MLMFRLKFKSISSIVAFETFVQLSPQFLRVYLYRTGQNMAFQGDQCATTGKYTDIGSRGRIPEVAVVYTKMLDIVSVQKCLELVIC